LWCGFREVEAVAEFVLKSAAEVAVRFFILWFVAVFTLRDYFPSAARMSAATASYGTSVTPRNFPRWRRRIIARRPSRSAE
jgi:hypothetical protein